MAMPQMPHPHQQPPMMPPMQAHPHLPGAGAFPPPPQHLRGGPAPYPTGQPMLLPRGAVPVPGMPAMLPAAGGPPPRPFPGYPGPAGALPVPMGGVPPGPRPTAPAAPIGDPNNEATNWSEHDTPDGRKYWYNRVTQLSTYDKPLVLKTPEERSIAPCKWKEYTSPEGKKYYSDGTETT